jgi:hypothetical protein
LKPGCEDCMEIVCRSCGDAPSRTLKAYGALV